MTGDRPRSRVEHADTFVIVPGWLIELAAADAAPPKALNVYCALGTFADNKTGECWPTRQAVAAKAGCSMATLDRTTGWLVKVGAVSRRTVDAEAGEGGQKANVWTLHRAEPNTHPRAGRGRTSASGGASPVRPKLDSGELESATDVARGTASTRNSTFDALAAACGLDYDQMTERERKACGVASAQLAKLTDVPDEAEMRRRARNYLTHFDTTVTPNALVSHWAQCARSRNGQNHRNGVQSLEEREADRLRAVTGEPI